MFLYKLATETAGEILSDAGLTIVIGVVVVFSVLLLLTGVFKCFGIVVGRVRNEQTAQNEEIAAPATPAVTAPVAAPAPVADLGPVLSSAQVRNGIEPEVTAVIAATVASCMPAGQKYTIKKIDLAD